MGSQSRREPHAGGLAALLCLLLLPAGAPFSVLEEPSHRQGRRMFGGYRIVPRACKPSSDAARGGKAGADGGATGVCMFNYECTRRGGEVVGACMDGFLFGACCSLPPGAPPPPPPPPAAAQGPGLGPVPSPPSPPLPAAAPPTPAPPTVDHPQADTVLVHFNGSEVVDNDLSEELFRPSTLQRPAYTEPDTDLLLPSIHSTHTTLEPKHTTFALVTNVQEYTNERVTNGRPMVTHLSSRVPTASYVTRPASSPSSPRPVFTTKLPLSAKPTSDFPHTSLADTNRPDTAEDSSTEEATKTSLYDSPSATHTRPHLGDEVVTENVESINHILWILNDTEPFADPEPMPDPEPIPDPEPEAMPQGGLSTWGSVNGLETSSARPTVFRPVGSPTKTSTTTTTVARPVSTLADYHKTQYPLLSDVSVSESFRPGGSATHQHDTSSFYHTSSTRPTSKPPAPTVIVLGPLSSDFTTTRPSSRLPPTHTTSQPTNRPSTISSSYPTSHPTYSSSKPSYTTTEDYDGTTWTKHPLITVSRPSTYGVRPPSTDYHLHTSSSYSPESPTHTRPVTAETSSYRPSTSVTVRPTLGGSSTFYTSTSRPVDKYTSPYTSGLITTFITKRPPLSTVQSSTTNIPSKTPTILYTSSTSIRPSLGSMRPSSQSTIYAHSPTPGGPTIITKIPSDDRPVTSVDDLANFPPVRNPSLNTSFSQHERPPLLADEERPVLSTEAALVPEDELLENEITTPEFVEDDKLNSKLQLFVDKIVESLQGNFEDLEDVLYKRRNTTTTTPKPTSPTRRPTRRPATSASTGSRPTARPSTSARPTRPSTAAASGRPTRPPSTLRPGTSVRPPATRPPATRPQTQRPATSQRPPATRPQKPGVTQRPGSQRPSSQRPSSQRPSSQKPSSQRPTRPPASPTPRPTTRPSTTRRPTRPSTARPTPTRRSTTTSSYTNLIEQEDTTKPSRIPTVTQAPTAVTTVTPGDQEAVLADSEEETTALETTLTTGPPVTTTTTTTTTHRPVDYRHECGVRPLMQKHGRIVGGKGAAYGAWPWQVLVRESTWLGLFTKNKCGGVLLSNRYVVTAAHCQPGFLANLVAVLGEFDISGDRESKSSVTRNVRRVVVHRDYDAATFANDLALLELETQVHFDEHIVPICLPRDGEDFTGRIATVTGWGRLKYGGGVPSVLQEVQVPVIDNAVCQEMFLTAGHQKQILSSFLCAGYAHGQKDSCEGDSGGPLMLERPDGRWTLVGTVSHGIKCAAPYLPGVYMRTTYYKPWLKSIIGIK